MKHLAVLFFLSLVAPLLGQTVDPLVYTVGKVFPGATHHHAYVLWQPGDPSATFGKEFAIYRKDGDSNSNDPYLLLGRTKLQTGPGAIHALLKLGGRFDHNAERVGDRINTLYAESLNEPGSQPPPPAIPTIAEAKKLAHLLKLAATDLKILERLSFLGRAHPGVYLSLGHAFSVKTTATAVQTYEVREIDGNDSDLRVVGRVTLDSANSVPLPRTSRPFEVFYQPKVEHQEVASPRNHLVTRQRWGIPNELRRQLPHTFGFNLYRVKESTAIAQGWHLSGTFPDTLILENLVQSSLAQEDPAAKRVNTLPLIAGTLMTETEAANTTADSETFFAHDDNNPPTKPFTNGEAFYYFVAARDIAGYPGSISEGTRVILCDRLPPTAPSIESVTNVFKTASAAALSELKGNQHLRIRIRQNPESPIKDAAKKYYIYRWSEHTEHLSLGGNPNTNLVGIVDHLPGQSFVDFDDNGVGAPKVTPTNSTEFGRTWWYTVRAEDDAACMPKNLSPHSPPGFGVLRDRVGPLKPSGFVTRCRYLPQVICDENIQLESPLALGLAADFEGFVARFVRETSMVASFDFEVIDENKNPVELLFKTSRFFQLTSSIDVSIPIDFVKKPDLILRVRARLSNGVVSGWVTCPLGSISNSSGLIPVAETRIRSLERCTPVTGPPGSTPDPHDVVGPGDVIVGPTLTGTLPLDTHEFRFYRRVGDDGAFELLFRGSGSALPASLPGNVSMIDPAPPTECDTEVCYFLQVFDQNGNSGARTKIGCVTMKNGDLGVPMVSAPTSLIESGGKAQLRLKWFCDPVGVERFEIWCASSTQADPEVESLLIGSKLDTLDSAIVAGSDSDSPLTFCGYQTVTRESGKLGSGAQFSATLSVPAGQELTFAVRAVGKGSYQNPPINDLARPIGPFSNTVTATWSTPDLDPQQVIPWPALGVPGASDQSLQVAHYQAGEGPFFALPLPNTDTKSSAILMGAFNATRNATTIPQTVDPLSFFFTFREQNIHPVALDSRKAIYPFVIYRHQVSSTTYPNAVANLIQVSPLIDRISYGDQADGERVLRDPFFRLIDIPRIIPNQGIYDLPVGGTFSRTLTDTVLGSIQKNPDVPYYRDFNSLMFWVDPMPITKGANYQYLIVHFTDRGEIDRVIPTNIVEH